MLSQFITCPFLRDNFLDWIISDLGKPVSNIFDLSNLNAVKNLCDVFLPDDISISYSSSKNGNILKNIFRVNIKNLLRLLLISSSFFIFF